MTKATRTNLLSLGIGLLIFAGLLYWIRASEVLKHLAKVGPWIIPVILGYGIAQFCFVLAWRALIDMEDHPVSLWDLFRVYLVGDAVNYVVVSGTLAGEPVKAYMLRDRLPMVKGLSSVTINKLSETVSMILFQAMGIVLAFAYHLLTPEMAWATLLVFTLMSTGIALFFWRQKKGLFGWIFRGLARIGIARSFLEGMSKRAETLDAQIADFYDAGGRRFAVSLSFNLLGWAGGAVEAYFLLRLLGISASLPMVWAIETISILANNVFFFIPGRLGGGDTGKVLAFRSMGMTSALGLTFGLLRRAREIFYVTLGFLFLAQMNFSRRGLLKGAQDSASSPTDEVSARNTEESGRSQNDNLVRTCNQDAGRLSGRKELCSQ